MKLNQRFLRCKRCNRKLKTDEAQIRGYGHHCFQMHLKELGNHNKNLFDLADELNHEKRGR